ncbi:MAG: hypothetical protein R3247_09350 [Rhodothermales bacterium]|nr:hypothetical protein [Rhodothermales bacterium]
MRLAALLILTSVFTLSVAPPSRAQEGEGVAALLRWPAALYEEDGASYPYDLLPALDSLALGYRYDVHDGAPRLRLTLAWAPGPVGVLENERVAAEAMPGRLRLLAAEIQADVVAEGRTVARLHLVLDSLALAPLPDRHRFTLEGQPWEAIFEGVTGAEARALFAGGFTLDHLEILRIAFASYEDGEGGRPYDPRRPTGVGVYPPRIGVWVDWIGPPRARAGKRGADRARPEREPRETVGRTPGTEPDRDRTREGGGAETERSGDRSGDRAERDRGDRKRPSRPGKKRNDDEKDDDAELLPVALAGAAAVGALAIGGGTVGYFGNTEAPLGLAAGRVAPHAGLLLQVAVNDAVLGAPGDETFVGRATTFYDLLGSRIQPALGLGVFAREQESGDAEWMPSVSLGAVGNFGSVLVLGGYDVVAGGVDVGLAFNWRHRRGR